MVKKAAALTNAELGHLDEAKRDAIVAACDEIIIDGALHEHFCVDCIQGGAGTSTNMNANEVIANRALEIMGYTKGEYKYLHPNNDVNMSQSTNDVYPTAARLAMLMSDDPLIAAVRGLMNALDEKAVEFADMLKLGRTQLQDAVPMTLGQEFTGWSNTLGKDLEQMEHLATLFATVNLGGTAIGTGINTDPLYKDLVIQKLAQVSGFSTIQCATDMIDASSDMGDFMLFSGMVRRLAVKLSKIANDLRLLSSGPRGGFNDINLPAVQPGSSIMPGKVNPVIPEAINQAAYQVIGNDVAITFAAEAGQLQLNAMEPLIIYNMLSSMRILTNAIVMLTNRCVRQITANADRCREMVQNSIGIVTAFSPFIGYEASTNIAKEALTSGRNVLELIRRDQLLAEEMIATIMKPENLTGPSSLLSSSSSSQQQTQQQQPQKRRVSLFDGNRSLTHMSESSGDASYFNTVLDEDAANVSSRHGRPKSSASFPSLIHRLSIREVNKNNETQT
jgi:aspartate ammonia-lyase